MARLKQPLGGLFASSASIGSHLLGRVSRPVGRNHGMSTRLTLHTIEVYRKMAKITAPLFSEDVGYLRLDFSHTKEQPFESGFLMDDFLFGVQSVLSIKDGPVRSLTSGRIVPLIIEAPIKASFNNRPAEFCVDGVSVSCLFYKEEDAYIVKIEDGDFSEEYRIAGAEIRSNCANLVGIYHQSLVERYGRDVVPEVLEAYVTAMERITSSFDDFPLFSR